jgi:hypothetical protein
VCSGVRRFKLGPYSKAMQVLSQMQKVHKRIPFDEKAGKCQYCLLPLMMHTK